MKKNILYFFFLSFLFGTIGMKAQTFLKFEQTTGALTTSTSIVGVNQSSGTPATIAQMNDLSFTTGALTTSMVNASVTVDMGSARTIAYVDLGARSSTSYLNNRSIQVSTDGITWTTVVPSITGASTSVLVRYSFTPTMARYVRVYNPAATAGIVGVSEFIPETISNLILAPAGADTRSTVSNLPFPITFKGVTHTKYSVNSNGLMRLGATVVSTTGTNVTREAASNPKLFAYWDNLATGTAATNGGVRTWSIGASPNRTFVIDWLVNNANSTTGASNMHFQIRISENTGTIEYVYGAGTTAASNTASIGMATSATDFISVTALGSPATISYFNFNDAITNAWPGNGVVYRFTPTTYPSTTTVPGTDFANLQNAVGALNWAGVAPAGGTTINISGAHTETVPSAITVAPVAPAGLLLRASGTAANPIVINGNGATLTAGTGNYNWDYVLGLAGVDYVTINNFQIRENTVGNNTNLKRAEIGIALFKKQYSTSLGNDGCQFVSITNNNIELTRLPNAVRNTTITNGGNGTSEVYYSRGIFACRWNNTHTSLAGASPGDYSRYSRNVTYGIKTSADVHSNNTINGNTINECSLGIELDDHYLLSGANLFAGENNVIGASGAGNTITNWGPTGTTIYTSTSYDNGGTHFAGISVAGQKNYTVEHNTIGTVTSETSTSSDVENYIGINIGRNHIYQASPMRGNTNFFIKVNNNAIQGIDATVGIDNKTAQGIVLQNGYLSGNTSSASYAVNGPIEINNNTITNLRTRNGKVAGIGTFIKNYSSYEPSTITSITYMYNYWFTNGTASINNNTITNIVKTPTNVATTSYGLTSAIQWNIPVNALTVDNNTIGGAGANEIKIETSNFINQHTMGLRALLIDMNGTSYTNRATLSVSNNNIANVNRVVTGSIASYANQDAQGASAIYVGKGAITNTIHNNTINGMTVANGLYGAAVNQSLEVIKVLGNPKTGLSTVNITNNNISNITRNHFGFLTSMGAGSGLNSYTSAIVADYVAAVQTKNISGNTISAITQTNTYTTTAAQQATFYSQLYGIRARGKNATNDEVNIFNNTISNLTGANWNYTGALSATSVTQYTTAWNVVGINVADYQKLNVYNNEICGLSTTHTGGTATTSVYAHGVLGINFGKSSSTAAVANTVLGEAVYNNFIGDLSAPNINSLYAVQGIYYWGYGRYGRIVHNTIALGNPDGGATGRLATTSANSFGVSGVSFNNAYWNSKSYPTVFANNLISVNATPKGSTGATVLGSATTGGFATAWRHISQSTAKKKPLGIDNASNGNVYFINDDIRNYIYGQGTRYWTSTNGIRNAYGYYLTGAPATYVNASRNMVNDINFPGYFNELCGKYKSFWGAPERASFIDVNGANVFQPLPFVNAGASCKDKLKLANGSNSYAGSATRYNNLLDVSTDYFSDPRSATEVTAGAHENSTNVTGTEPANIQFDYTPVCDGVCTGSKEITVKITPPSGKTIATTAGVSAPRIYFRRIRNNSTISAAQSDNNVMVNAANNIATGTEGWRWVEATTISGDDYTFSIDESLLKSTIATTPTYQIEYFVIAQSTDGLATSWSSGDFSDLSCPSGVDLFSLGGATQVPADTDGDTLLDENSVADSYTVYRGTDLTKQLELVNNGVTYTANTATAITVCKDDEIKLNADYFITALGVDEGVLDEGCITYKLEVADNTAFTTNLQSFTSTNKEFTYVMPVGTKYFRFWLDCGGSNVASTNTTYIGVVALDCPTNTTAPVADIDDCAGQSQSITVSTTSTFGTKYFWVANPFGKLYTVPPGTASTAPTLSKAITINPSDVNEAGVWKTYVTNATGQSLTDQIIKAPEYFDVDSSSYSFAGTSASAGTGVAFTTTKMIKLNQISVVGASGDGSATTGWNVQLYGKDGQLIYTQAGASAADNSNSNAVTNVTLANWFIPPGDYMIALGETTPGTEPVGALGSFAIDGPLNQANTNTPTIIINGGVEGLDYTSIDNSVANYFTNWDYQEFCTSPATTFNFNVVPASCCLVPVLPTYTVTSDLPSNECGLRTYTVTFNNATGATVNDLRFFTSLDAGQTLVDASITPATVYGGTLSTDPYGGEPNFEITGMSLPTGTRVLTFQVDVNLIAVDPNNLFTLETDCATNKREVVWPEKACEVCEGGSLKLASRNAWFSAGATGRTTNAVSNVAIGAPTSGAVQADINVTYPATVEYIPNSFPRRYSSWAQLSRRDNINGDAGKVTYTVDLKDALSNPIAAKPSFQIRGISSQRGANEVVTVKGMCGAEEILGVITPAGGTATQRRNTISGNVVTGSKVNYDYYSWSTVNVTFEKPVTQVTIEWKVDRTNTRRNINYLYIGDMSFVCNNVPEPNADNVNMFASFVESDLPTCEEATVKLTIQNLNCDDKTINLSNSLPAGLEYVADSYVGLDTEVPAYSGSTLTLNGLVVPKGSSDIFVKVKPTAANLGTTATYNVFYNYTVAGGTNIPNPYRSDDLSGVSGFQDASVNYTAASPISKPIVNKTVSSCYSPGTTVLTYTVTIQNTSASAITNVEFEDLLSAAQSYITGSLTQTNFVADGTATLDTDPDNSNRVTTILIDGMEIGAGQTATITFQVNPNFAEMTVDDSEEGVNPSNGETTQFFVNQATVVIDPTSECGGGTSVFDVENVYLCTYCTKDPNTDAATSFTSVGVSTQATKRAGWPEDMPNGFIVLESKDKGFVITRLTTAQRDALTTVEGMLIYNTSTNAMELYNGTSWIPLTRSCND